LRPEFHLQCNSYVRECQHPWSRCKSCVVLSSYHRQQKHGKHPRTPCPMLLTIRDLLILSRSWLKIKNLTLPRTLWLKNQMTCCPCPPHQRAIGTKPLGGWKWDHVLVRNQHLQNLKLKHQPSQKNVLQRCQLTILMSQRRVSCLTCLDAENWLLFPCRTSFTHTCCQNQCKSARFRCLWTPHMTMPSKPYTTQSVVHQLLENLNLCTGCPLQLQRLAISILWVQMTGMAVRKMLKQQKKKEREDFRQYHSA